MKKNFIFIIVLLLSQQYLSAQYTTVNYSLTDLCDAQTQKIKACPNNTDQQVVLSKDGNRSFFYLLSLNETTLVKRVELTNGFEAYDFDLYGDTIIFCGRKLDNGTYKGFIGVATFQSLFNNSPYWIPIIDNQIGLIERVLLYKEGTSLYAACYTGQYALIYKYDGNFSTVKYWCYDLEDYLSPIHPFDTVLITDFVVTNSSIIYVGMLNHFETSVKLYRVDRDFSLATPTMKRFAILPNSRGNGGVISQLNKDTVIIAISNWDNVMETNVYVMDINDLSSVSSQQVRGYKEKLFPIDIVYNSTEKEILYLQHSALNLFPRERRDVLYRLQAFPNGNYQADVVYKDSVPTATFEYNSINLISREKITVCGRDYSSGRLSCFEQIISRMQNVGICLKYTFEPISVSNINLLMQTEDLNTPVTQTRQSSLSYPASYYHYGMSINCNEE